MKLPATRDTGVARLPGLPPVNAQDPSLRSWMTAVAERLEVREGSRGNPWERAVTVRELQDMTTVTTRLLGGRDGKVGDGELVVDLGGGLTAGVDIDRFIASIKNSTLYRDLIKRLDDPTRFDDVVEEVRTILLRDIATEAAARGADIQRMEVKLQNADRSLAYTVQEITAALGQASAGVREVQWAFATSDKAQAGKILQLQARLNNFYPNGGAGTATIEEQFGVYADYALGLRGQYSLKINAGTKAVVGFGLAATEIDGVPESAFIIQADKFAIVSSAYTGGLNNTPDVLSVPFGVDASGVYINGKVRINAAGKTLESLGALTSGAIVYAYQRSLNPVTTRPGRVEWTFASATITNPLGPSLGGGWSKEIPFGTLPLYVTAATVAGSEATDWIENAEWSTPVLLSTNGIDGLNTATVQLYRRTESATAPLPIAVNDIAYNFTSKTLSGSFSPWQADVPNTPSDYLWVTRATAASITLTDDLPASEWSAPALMAKNGTKGTNGSTGDKGVRGSVTLSLTDPTLTAWSDAKADGLIAARTDPPFRNVIGDTVTLTNGLSGPSAFIQTKYWGGIGVEWTTAGVIIDGNLLVNGSISGSKIAAGTLSAGQVNFANTYGAVKFDTDDGGTGTVLRISAATPVPPATGSWGLIIDPGNLRVAGDVVCGPILTSSVYSTGVFSASTVTSRGGFGCNGKSAQGPFSLGAAATDLATVITLTNNIRAILIANGIGSA